MLRDERRDLRIRRHVVGARQQRRIAPQHFADTARVAAQDVLELIADDLGVLHEGRGLLRRRLRRLLGGGRGTEAEQGDQHRKKQASFHDH